MKNILYLGTDPTYYKAEGKLIHFPIIELISRPIEEIRPTLEKLKSFTHLIFTSKHGVSFFFQFLKALAIDVNFIKGMTILAIGASTGRALDQEGVKYLLADEATQEGVIALLKQMPLKKASVLLPRSAQAREALTQFLEQQQIHYVILDLYDPMPTQIKPFFKLQEVDEVVFTSPSTVQAFFQMFKSIPSSLIFSSIGPITEKALERKLQEDR